MLTFLPLWAISPGSFTRNFRINQVIDITGLLFAGFAATARYNLQKMPLPLRLPSKAMGVR